MKEKVIMIGVDFGKRDFDIKAAMKELGELVEAAEGQVIAQLTQKIDSVNARLFIGKGKAEELAELVEELEADTVVINEELSGTQLRNLEELIGCKIIDRTNLILDIFATRATTLEGKLQVQLAQMKYRLPRIIGYSDYLSKLGGGIGTRGPGESQLETDRRHVMREIRLVEDKLFRAKENRHVTRKKREKSSLPLVSLLGYTNAGKSTLMNAILNTNPQNDEVKEVFVKDMLFATLDTAHRSTKFNSGASFLISDTVGFVSKLPTALVNAFEGTLDEIRYADLILHVVDLSNPNLDLQMETTAQLLKSMDVNTPILTVFNKIDRVNMELVDALVSQYDEKVFISALDSSDVSMLLNKVESMLNEHFVLAEFLVPFDDLAVLDIFMKNYEVQNLEYNDQGAQFKASVSHEDASRYARFIIS